MSRGFVMIRKKPTHNEKNQLRTMASNKAEEIARDLVNSLQFETISGRPFLSFDVIREVILNELVRLHFEKISKQYHAGRITEQLVNKCGLPYSVIDIVEIYIK
jgi:hypothetical protein